ncbi:MAG: hypothetical protein E7168_05075 [Firmicutes bacterium]|nr:hypothetical protein [Bacillota bacterium]
MNKICYRFLQIICVCATFFIVFSLIVSNINIDKTNEETNLLILKKISITNDNPIKAKFKQKKQQNKVVQVASNIDTTNFPVLAVSSGTVSHYGHDCYGCTTGRTASGYYVGDGRLYYPDPTYGNIRIVAAGPEYELGTILRLTNVESKPILVIVLDRGGDIGIGRRYILDLLAESNEHARQLGIRRDVIIEVLRSGY